MRAVCALSKVAAFAALLFVLPGVSAANPQLRYVADELAIGGAIAVGTCPLPPLLA